MVLKLLAFGCEYFKDKNNIFDFVLVMTSLWELFSKTGNKASALRSLRLLRFMRLLHFMPYLRRQLLVLKKTIKKAASFFLLLLFFIFIFSIFGMLLFGGKFNFMTENGDIITDRKNFDTLHWSMVTVFQVLTLEDWNLVLYNAMSTVSPWAMIYFFLLVVLGTRVLLYVLVGMVYESFQEISSADPMPSKNDPRQIDGSQHDPESSKSSVPDPTPVQHLTLPDTSESEESLNLIQNFFRWCKDREEWSFYVFSPQNRFRIMCQRMITHFMFDFGVLFLIFLSCVTIAVERPGIDPQSTERFILNISNYVISALFLVEMLLKVVALGLVFGKNSYCRSLWNIIDGLLVIMSAVQIAVSLISKGKSNMPKVLKVLRLFRTFRPLRVIKRAPRLKLAVEALIASVKPIGNILIICCTFLFFFGILGVQLFKGKFHHCLGRDIRNITTKTECLAANYGWTGKIFNFDSFPQALMSLFVMYSKDGWVNIMYDGLDAVGVDIQPVRNHNEWMLFFFIPFMVMSFFLLDMFIGVMVDTFHQCQQEQNRADELALRERGEVLPQHGEPEQIPYFANYGPLRRAIHTLCTSSYLDMLVSIVLFLNVMVMGVEHYNQPQFVKQLIEYSSYVFIVVFSVEILLKLVAFGAQRFLKSRLNLLDVGILLASLLSVIYNKMNITHLLSLNPSILRMFRVLSLAQVLKAKNIRVLLKTIMKTLSQVGNICFLLVFFFFIYAALGVELFGRLECTQMDPCQGLHRYSNFKHFGTALLTLYKVCTGDNWSGILKDTLRKCPPDGCANYLSWAAPPYFITFVIIAQFVLLNLVVAVIMQALEESKEEEQGQSKSTRENTGPVQPVD
ncbi:voltage-dependent T-type calcium channel subunit alpha-1H-like [Halichoeres trimaculatus]|uniref:voltage-dependent T-type calcium channel subunit alpha-1H-like n=1 Tax=Halichoeres trimaculatus TaxID=147232 RepID=UPI003D9DF77F